MIPHWTGSEAEVDSVVDSLTLPTLPTLDTPSFGSLTGSTPFLEPGTQSDDSDFAGADDVSWSDEIGDSIDWSDESSEPSVAEADLRKLYVTGLSAEIREKELAESFRRFGELQEVSVMRHVHSDGSRGYAFVTFKAAEGAAAAVGASPVEVGDKAGFSVEFLNLVSGVFDLMDVEEAGSLNKERIIKDIRTKREVIQFVNKCGSRSLQYLLVPSRLKAWLEGLHADDEITKIEWEDLLRRKEFLHCTTKIFDMIDFHHTGFYEKALIVRAVEADPKVAALLDMCRNVHLRQLLVPQRLRPMLEGVVTERLDDKITRAEWRDALEAAMHAKLLCDVVYAEHRGARGAGDA